MRWPIAFLIVLLVALQYPLWLGRGGWLRVWEIDKELQTQRVKTHKLEQRNASLDAEVRDLRIGTEALEERARYELGFVKPGEIFVQVPNRPVARTAAPAPASPPGQ
jgi:cell division protein FtsB